MSNDTLELTRGYAYSLASLGNSFFYQNPPALVHCLWYDISKRRLHLIWGNEDSITCIDCKLSMPTI
jgi:hypothetical protein